MAKTINNVVLPQLRINILTGLKTPERGYFNANEIIPISPIIIERMEDVFVEFNIDFLHEAENSEMQLGPHDYIVALTNKILNSSDYTETEKAYVMVILMSNGADHIMESLINKIQFKDE